MNLYSIGYEKQPAPELLAQLREHKVRYLADVREWPFCRFTKYTPDILAVACGTRGMEYMPYRKLGVPRELRTRGRAQGLEAIREDYYSLLVNDRETNRAFAHLVGLVAGNTGPVCLLCYERDHRTCHRSILAELLTGQIDNLTVIHLNSPPPGE